MFLVNVNEAFGYTHEQTLNSSYAVLRNMLAEYNYMWKERNRELENTDDGGEDFEWVELPDWDNPTKINRIKKYKDISNFIPNGKL